jgi:hypothetical protein
MSNDEREAQTYAWNWFVLHSGQRLQMVNFWLVSVAFLAAAFVQARASHLSAVALGVSITGMVASLSFMRLDVRTRQLVRVAENALRSLEEKRTAGGLDQTFELVKWSHEGRHSFLDSYRVIIQSLQLLVAFMFFLAAIYSIVSI